MMRWLALLLLAPLPALAHPHVYADYAATVTPQNLHLEFTLDSMYSVVVRSEVIMNDTERSLQEETLKTKGVDLLTENPIAIYMTLDGQHQPPQIITLTADKVTSGGAYIADLPLPTGTKNLAFMIYDETYYVSVAMKEGNAGLSSKPPVSCTRERVNVSETIWGLLRADRTACRISS